MKKQTCNCSLIGFILFLIGITGALGAIGLYGYFASPKFEVGECLLNRVGETLQVGIVYPYLKEYYLYSTKYAYDEYSQGFKAEKVVDMEHIPATKSMDFVEKNYIKIPCER